MDRTAATAAALLLVLAAVTAGVVPSTAVGGAATTAAQVGQPVPTDNSSARMVLPRDDLDRSGVATVGPDLGSSLSAVGEDVSQARRHLVVVNRFEDANSTDGRRLVMDQALIDLEEATTALEEHQHEAIRRYANGSIDGTELLRRLAAIDQQARDMLETVEYLRSGSNRMPGRPLISRINEVEGRLDLLTGPVRNEAASIIQGGTDRGEVYVQVSGQDFVLATIDDGTFLREAYTISNRETEGFPELENVDDALNRNGEYYPWALNNTISGRSTAVQKLGDVYRTVRPHRQGQLVAFFDAISGEVIYEVQRLDAAAMPTTTVRQFTDAGLQVVLERTYPGGPMRVEVTDAETGEPVEAAVTVDGVDVGSTGTDGVVRLVEPRVVYELTVTAAGTSTNVTITPPRVR